MEELTPCPDIEPEEEDVNSDGNGPDDNDSLGTPKITP